MHDEINDDIWRDSPAVQRSVQPPEVLGAPGAVGAQQAMIDGDDVLPWVPDLIGSNWRNKNALIIVGSAYAGFIREFSGRGATMPLSDYRTARTWQDFQERFVATVVHPDVNYYRRLTALAGG